MERIPDRPPAVPSRVPSLRANFAWALVGSTTFQLCQWVVVVAITKLSSTAVAGDWGLALALTAPIFLFTQLKLRAVETTDVNDEFSWADYAANRIVGSLTGILLAATVVAVAYRGPFAPLVIAIAVAKALDGGSDLIYGRFQRHERQDLIGRSLVGRGLTSLVAGVVAFVVTRDAIWAAVATAASYLPWLWWDIRRLHQTIGGSLFPVWNRVRQRALVARVLPLGFVTAIGSLQTNIPRYFVDATGSRTDVGVFGNLSYLLIAGNLVVAAVANAVLPRLAGHAADRAWRPFTATLRSIVLVGMVLAAIAVVLCLLFGEPVLRWLYSEQEAANADVLVLMAVAAGLVWSYVFLGTALDAMRRFTIQPWIHGTSTAVIAGACALLVPAYGLRGAAWATLIGYGVECALYVVAVAVPLRRAAQVGTAPASGPGGPKAGGGSIGR